MSKPSFEDRTDCDNATRGLIARLEPGQITNLADDVDLLDPDGRPLGARLRRAY